MLRCHLLDHKIAIDVDLRNGDTIISSVDDAVAKSKRLTNELEAFKKGAEVVLDAFSEENERLAGEVVALEALLKVSREAEREARRRLSQRLPKKKANKKKVKGAK